MANTPTVGDLIIFRVDDEEDGTGLVTAVDDEGEDAVFTVENSGGEECVSIDRVIDVFRGEGALSLIQGA